MGVCLMLTIGCRKDNQNSTNTTTKPTPSVTLTTNNVSSITSTTAYLNGYVSYTGVSGTLYRGFVVGPQYNPTISIGNSTWYSGSGSGSFGVSCSGLSSNTTYYVRAWAYEDCPANGIWYGNNVSFTTSAGQSQICVWTSLSTFPCSSARIDVYIDDSYKGYLSSYYTSVPDCGYSGTVTVNVSPGSHKFFAKCNSGSTTWGPSYYTVSAGACFKWKLN